jgi:hypothetical protein
VDSDICPLANRAGGSSLPFTVKTPFSGAPRRRNPARRRICSGPTARPGGVRVTGMNPHYGSEGPDSSTSNTLGPRTRTTVTRTLRVHAALAATATADGLSKKQFFERTSSMISHWQWKHRAAGAAGPAARDRRATPGREACALELRVTGS